MRPNIDGVGDAFLSQALKQMLGITGWLTEGEGTLLSSAVTLALIEADPAAIVEIGSYHGRSTILLGSILKRLGANTRVYAIDPHEGDLSEPDESVLREGSTLESLQLNLSDAGLDRVVEVVRKRSFEVSWSQPISLLLVDGLHDYESVRRDFKHFEPWLTQGGYIAFHDYDRSSFPGVPLLVDELLGTAEYRPFACVDRLMVINRVSDYQSGTRRP